MRRRSTASSRTAKALLAFFYFPAELVFKSNAVKTKKIGRKPPNHAPPIHNS
jgi:hypothetical protein